MSRILESTRCNDYPPNWLETIEIYKTAWYQGLCNKVKAVLPSDWSVVIVCFTLGAYAVTVGRLTGTGGHPHPPNSSSSSPSVVGCTPILHSTDLVVNPTVFPYTIKGFRPGKVGQKLFERAGRQASARDTPHCLHLRHRPPMPCCANCCSTAPAHLPPSTQLQSHAAGTSNACTSPGSAAR